MLDFGVEADTIQLAHGFRIFGAEPGHIAQELANRATMQGLHIEYLSTLEPSLEEVFVHITSKAVTAPRGESHV
jgi:hypothetical protein